MLSEKPWKVEAVVRLVLGVFICMYAGSLLMGLLHAPTAAMKANWRFFLFTAMALILLGVALVFVRLPWKLENLWGRVAGFMICFYGAVLLGILAQKMAGSPTRGSAVQEMIVATLSFHGAGLILIVLFLREHQVSWAEAWGLSNHWLQAIFFGVVVSLIFFPIGWGLQHASIALMQHFIKPEEQQAVHALRLADSWLDRVALGTTAIVLAPVAEEIGFRGILYPAVKQRGFRRLAFWGTSLLFAAMHTNLATFVPLFVLAIFLTVLYEKTDNLLAPITAHSLFNAMNFLSFYLLQKQMA